MKRKFSRTRFSFKRKKNKNNGNRITLKNHRHAIRPMSGFTSIPLRFKGRRIS